MNFSLLCYLYYHFSTYCCIVGDIKGTAPSINCVIWCCAVCIILTIQYYSLLNNLLVSTDASHLAISKQAMIVQLMNE